MLDQLISQRGASLIFCIFYKIPFGTESKVFKLFCKKVILTAMLSFRTDTNFTLAFTTPPIEEETIINQEDGLANR